MPTRAAETVLSFDEARSCVEQHAAALKPGGAESAEPLAALGRVLAEGIHADRDYPPFPRATRDGYAVRAADVATVPAKLKVIGQVKAGSALPESVKMTSGTCAEIMTGAPVPSAADAVVMVEFTEVSGDEVTINRTASIGENIVPRGSEGRSGALLLAKGTRLGHAQVAVSASVGRARVAVYRKPRIAILSTGDEVIDISAAPGPYQIRNSNSFSLAAQIIAAGAEPLQLAIAPDEPKRLRELIAEGLNADMLLLSGGVSMGKYDLVEDVLRDLSAEFFFTGAKIQPGKPIVFGRASARQRSAEASAQATAKYFFGLPGNPLSTMVTFTLFAKPMIEALSGAPPAPLLFATALLTARFETKPGITRFLPATLSGPHSAPQVELIRWQGSGDVVSMSKANCLLVIPPDKESIAAGEQVAVLLP